MDPSHLVRRAVHLSAPLFLVYYWIPDEVMGVDKGIWLIALATVFFAFELWRLASRATVLGMRDYEMHRMSAAAWFVLAALISLLFFPLGYTAPAFLGMGLVDPLIGELRMRSSRLNPVLPVMVYFGLAMGSMAVFFGIHPHVVVAAVLATALALWVEALKIEWLDDDFTMIVVPLLGISLTFALLA